MRTFLIGVAVGVAAVLFGPTLVGDLARSSGQTAGATAAPAASTAPAAATGGGVVSQVSAVDRALAQARTTGKTVPVTLTFTERDLTASAAAYFPQSVSGATLTDPVVHLGSGGVELDMTASAAFVRTSAVVVATVGVQSGRPAANVVSATIGGAALPSAVSAQVATQLDQALGAGLPAKFVVSTISVATGVMTVTGVANP